MKPDIACPNHPKSEGLFPCRYCRENFCEACALTEPGFYRCRRPACVKAYQKEAAGPLRRCPHCVSKNLPLATFCGRCGGEMSSKPPKDPETPVTVGRYAGVTEAGLARATLASQGIDSFVADEAVGTLYSGGNTFLGGVRLQTRAADSQKAQELLAARPKGRGKAQEPTGSCRYCGKILSKRELAPGPGPLHCRKAKCLKAYRAEMKSLARVCPSCRTKIPYPEVLCPKCGKKLAELQLGLEPGELPASPVGPEEKWDFRWAFLLWLTLFSVEVAPCMVFSWIHYRKGVLPDPHWIQVVLYSSELACVFLALYWTKRFQSLSWGESLRHMGFKAPNPRQLLAGVLILLPVLVGDFLAFQGYQQEGVPIQLKWYWGIRLSDILVGAALFEETLYRGFLFRFLRRGRSFTSAAVLSSGLWALSHVTHLMPLYGPEHSHFQQAGGLMLQVFVDGLMGAYLFEKGGNNIWGWMLVHIGYDLFSLVNLQGSDFYVSSIPENYFDIGHWFSVLATILIVLWIFPAGKGKKPRVAGVFRGNALSLKWKPLLLPLVITSALVLAFCLVPSQRLCEEANNQDWQKIMDSRPRFADGYREWAFDLWKLDKYDEAVEKCRQALAIDPKNYKAWLLWGKALRGKNVYEDALEKFQQAAECAPRNAATYLWWGYDLEDVDQKDDAIEKYRTVLSLNPDETSFTNFANYRIERLEAKKRGGWQPEPRISY